MNNLEIVANIKKLCQEHNVSISQLEKDLYMSPGLISRWNRNMPTLDRIIDIAEYFGVPLDVIAGNTAEANHSARTTNRLVHALYQKSLNAEVEWEILNPKHPVNSLSRDILSVILSDENQNTFFCTYNNGYFFLTINYNTSDSKDYELRLFVLANSYAVPELRCSDTAKLHTLYEYLDRRFSKLLNTMKTDNFIDEFLNTSSLPESITTARNNISVLKSGINVVNQ